MSSFRSDIKAELQQQILQMQGVKPRVFGAEEFDAGLGKIKYAFPNQSFPIGAVHEFICNSTEDCSATSGFIAGLLSFLNNINSVSFWICPKINVFPPGLKHFGTCPDKIIFVEAPGQKERIWAIEEALKCDSISAVVGEIADIDFAESRRLQLAVERRNITGLLIRQNPKNISTASFARWRITQLATKSDEGLPGVGHPRWKAQLLRVRNGKPGSWYLEWKGNQFTHINPLRSVPGKVDRVAANGSRVQERKVG